MVVLLVIILSVCGCPCLLFFNQTAIAGIYTLSLHDALPILEPERDRTRNREGVRLGRLGQLTENNIFAKCERSEEHTSELQSRQYLVCRLLLEKKKRRPLASTRAMLPHTRPTSIRSTAGACR